MCSAAAAPVNEPWPATSRKTLSRVESMVASMLEQYCEARPLPRAQISLHTRACPAPHHTLANPLGPRVMGELGRPLRKLLFHKS